jgi:endoglycosylceramidase
VEPEPGKIDAAAIDRIERLVQKAAELDLYVILDMHQDLWARGEGENEAGRGAPGWTWQGNDQPHIHDPETAKVWSMAYFESPKIQAQFDRFWSNAPGPDGVGLMEHWLSAWRALVERFAGYRNVVGYDLFNEPFWGTRVKEPMERMTAAMLPFLIAGYGWKVLQKPPFELALLGMEKAQSNPILYRLWLKAGEGKFRQLDRELLVPAWDRAARMIREVDRRHIIFSGPTLPANFGARTGIRPVLGADGKPDPLYAYSAHCYDDSPARMVIIAEHILGQAAIYDKPLFLGEWGNLTNGDAIFSADPEPATRVLLERLEGFGASQAYWHYLDAKEHFPWFMEFLQRPYPLEINGWLEQYYFDYASGLFTCTWFEDSPAKATSRFYLPGGIFLDGGEVILDPPESRYELTQINAHSQNRILIVQPMPEGGLRNLIVRRRGENGS